MSKRELSSLGGGAASAQAPKRGAAADDSTDPSTWSRHQLQRHQLWEDGTLPFDQHKLVDAAQHDSWCRWSRRGGLAADILELPPKASGKNVQREAKRAVKEAAEAAAASRYAERDLPIPVMLQNLKEHGNRLNQLLRGAALLYVDVWNSGEFMTCNDVAQEVRKTYAFDVRTIKKNGEAMIKNAGFEPDVRGGKPTLLHNPLSHAFFEHVEKAVRRLDPQGQSALKDDLIEEFIAARWLEYYALNSGAKAPALPKATLKRVEERIASFCQKGTAQKKAERTAESVDDPRNAVSWAAVATAAIAGRPAELKCNWDDVSFMVAEEMGVKAIAYTHKEVANCLQKLGRNMSFHSGDDAGLGKMQCRMFVGGFLTFSSGKVPLCAIKFYDRQIPHQVNRIEKHYLGRLYNSCHLWWVFIKLPAQGDGSNDDEEVNRLVIGQLVAPTLQAEKLAYVKESKRILLAEQLRTAGSAAPNPAAALSNNSRVSMESQASNRSNRSHSGVRTNVMPPGQHTAAELFVRNEDNPAVNGGLLFQQRQQEEEEDSGDDQGSISDAASVPDDAAADLFDATLDADGADASAPEYDAGGSAAAAAPALAPSPAPVPAQRWIPETLEARFPNLMDINEQLQKEAAGGFEFRVALTLDGCCTQVQSLMGKEGSSNPNGVLHDIISPDGNDVIKGPSQCSMFSNANDAGRCHCHLKDYVKTKMKKKPVYMSKMMRHFLDKIVPAKGLDQATVRTIRYFASHLEDMICKVWTAPNVKSGWVKTGLLADTPSGIDVDQILSHWVGMKDLRQQDYDAVKEALPLLGQEAVMSASGSPSDASMAPLQKHFPKPFEFYKTDRAFMAWSRRRAAVMVSSKEKHQESFDADLPALGDYDDRCAAPPECHAVIVVEGVESKLCWCRAAATPNARLYKNTAAGWKTHKNTVAHKTWKAKVQGQPVEQAGNADADASPQPQTYPLFSEHPFAQKTDCAKIVAIAVALNMRVQVAKRFAELEVTDADIVMLAHMRPPLFEKIFGIPLALAVQFALACATAAAAE